MLQRLLQWLEGWLPEWPPKIPPDPLYLVWAALIISLVFVLIALLQARRIENRRQKEVMFGTKTFDDKVAERGFSYNEKEILDKIIRKSPFENKDAILNSSGLFEQAVSTYYDVEGINELHETDLAVVESLRLKMNFTASNPLA
jgi:hypothetical protein